MTTNQFLKRSWLGRCLVIAACLLTLIAAAPQTVRAATLVEYGLLLGLIAVVCIGAVFETPHGNAVLAQLVGAVEGARDASAEGDTPHELARVSKALGAAHALVGMTSACDSCDTLRSGLQEIIGTLAAFKTDIIGVVRTCHPNGIVQSNEQCDPLAVPTGCPITIELTFCNDECRCQPVPVP